MTVGKATQQKVNVFNRLKLYFGLHAIKRGLKLLSICLPAPIVIMLGLVLGAIVHLTSILLIPHFSKNSAYHRLSQSAEPYATVLISSVSPLDDDPYIDPNSVRSACYFDLSKGPVRISLPVTNDLVQTLSIHSEKGGSIYAVSDRAALQGVLSLLLLTQANLDELQISEADSDIVREVRIVMPVQRAFALTRSILPFASMREKVEEEASQLLCAPSPLQ